MTRTLSTLGSVSASRSVRSGRFYCSYYTLPCKLAFSGFVFNVYDGIAAVSMLVTSGVN